MLERHGMYVQGLICNSEKNCNKRETLHNLGDIIDFGAVYLGRGGGYVHGWKKVIKSITIIVTMCICICGWMVNVE